MSTGLLVLPFAAMTIYVMQMEIGLEDIRPQDCEVVVGGESFTLRKLTLDDESWLRTEFKDQQIFTDKMTDEQICRIAFHQLSIEDKRKFAPVDVILFNDETGEETKIKIGGWRLFRAKISGPSEKLELFKGILKNVGISRPMLEKILTPDEQKEMMLDSDGIKKKKQTGRK